MLHAAQGSVVAYSAVASRRGAVTILDAAAAADAQQPLTLSLLEGTDEASAAAATVLALGPHVVGRGGVTRIVYKVWRAPDSKEQPNQQWAVDYGAQIKDARLSSSFAAVLVAGSRIVLHSLADTEASSSSEEQRGIRRCFDDARPGRDRITCLALTEQLLVVGTERGKLALFSLASWAWVASKHPDKPSPQLRPGITSIVPNAAGTRFVYTDAQGAAYIHDPLAADEGEASPDLPLPELPVTADNNSTLPHIVWDHADPHIIMVHGGGRLHTYAYMARSTQAPQVAKLGAVETGAADGAVRIQPMAYDFPVGFVPLASVGGRLLSLSVPSTTASTTNRPPVLLKTFLAPVYQCLLECQPHLNSTSSPSPSHAAPPDRALLQAAFNQSLALGRLQQDAWRAALLLDDRQCWLALGNRAVEVLDLEMAVRVYRQLGDAGMVMGLEPLLSIEDPRMLAGHAALLFGRHDEAERLFLASSCPAAAMEMRRDLLQCDRALELAQLVAPGEVAATAPQYAQQLELHGDDHEAALRMYEVAERRRIMGGGGDEKEEEKALGLACSMGRARCTLRLGHVREGVKLALALGHKPLFRECAAILAGNKATLTEAADLYERAGLPETAVRLYLQVRPPDLAQAARLMPHVALPKLHALYARACEEAGRYAEAVAGYERARDLDSVVRLCLWDAYPRPERAFELVHATGSAAATMMAVAYCQQRGDVAGALRFLLLAQQAEAAFEYAKAQQRVDAYVQAVQDGGALLPEAEALRVAEYYEARQELAEAARFYRQCGGDQQQQKYRAKALKLALQCGAVDLAIDIVVGARARELTATLLRFLNGDADGVQKDAHHLYRLHLALGNHNEAAQAADLHATQQQTAGDYAAAHATLHRAIWALTDAGAPVPSALRAHFQLLHSYMLAKRLVQHGDHQRAAHLLLRIARRIADFPAHAAPILTSVVIEAQRAGLAGPAFQYASLLVTDPAYREALDPQLRRKFETIVRRGVGVVGSGLEEEDEKCQDDGTIPMCIASGRYMIAAAGDEVEQQARCVCPNSRMPALLLEYRRFLDAEAAAAPDGVAMDPVCGKPVRKADLVRVSAAEVWKGR